MWELMWRTQPYVDMLHVLSKLLNRPISLLRIDGAVRVETLTLGVSPAFSAWESSQVNPSHILLLHFNNHYSPLVLPAETQCNPEDTAIQRPSTTFAAIGGYFLDFARTVPSATYLGAYHLPGHPPEATKLTVCARELTL